MKNFESGLREIRREKEMTLDALEDLTGIPRSSISHFENGTRSMKPHRLRKIASALDVDVEDIEPVYAEKPTGSMLVAEENRPLYLVSREATDAHISKVAERIAGMLTTMSSLPAKYRATVIEKIIELVRHYDKWCEANMVNVRNERRGLIDEDDNNNGASD